MDGRAEQAQRNRERMPETAAVVERWKRRFRGARVQWVQEGGLEVGTRLPEARSMNVDQWLHYLKTGVTP